MMNKSLIFITLIACARFNGIERHRLFSCDPVQGSGCAKRIQPDMMTSLKITSCTCRRQRTANGCNQQCVPLANFVWSTNGTADIPASGDWSKFTGNAGTVDPSGSSVPFSRSNTFPSWNNIVVNGGGDWE